MLVKINSQTQCRPAYAQQNRLFRLRTLPLLLAMSFPLASWAAPDGGSLAAGSASISQSGATTLVTQSSQKAVINWNNFSIDSGETVRFAQPNASAIVLNRVTGSSPSSILGALQANGNVFLVNPNGVLFGSGAQVNVGGLVASTQSLSDADFMAGRYSFSGASGSVASIVNNGTITAAEGGYVALLAPQVSNRGLISARLGTVLLAGSDAVTLSFGSDGSMSYAVDRGALNALAENRQLIIADGGQVIMTALAASTLTQGLVRQDGVIEAHTVDNHAGTIRLLGDMTTGSVQVNGTLDASGDSAVQGSAGGYIETSAAHVSIADTARVTTAGTGSGATGTWLIDPVDFTIADSGGDITPAALASQLALNNIKVESTSGMTAGNGDIFVNNAVVWSSGNTLTLNAVRNIQVNAAITNSVGGSLILRADTGATGIGSIYFSGADSIAMSGGGRTDLYYNPVSFSSPTDFSGNISGAYTAWMLVNNVTALQAISGNLSGNYALGTNIDASSTSFSSLGNFSGMLDGQNYTISGLTINQSGVDNIALFANNSGTIRNLAMTSVNITGRNNSAALVGNNQGTISNVSVSGSVTANDYSGGLVGDNQSTGVISNSSFNGTVSGSAYVIGGLVGANEGTISGATTSGSVYAALDSVGGIVGRNNNTGIISNSQSSMAVSSAQFNVGGIAGLSLGTINASSASGSASGANVVGGLVGNNSGSINDSSSTAIVNGASEVGGLVGENSGAIARSWVGSAATVTASGDTVGGFVGNNTNTGTVTDSYSNAAVTAVGTAGGFVGANNQGSITNSYATGSVSGANAIHMGGFAGLSSGILQNVYATGDVSGSYWLGGLVGENATGGTISQSYATGNVTGTSGALGGIVGLNNGSVTTSYAIGNINGTSHLGGVVGENKGTISNSYSTSNITSSEDTIGGIAGVNDTTGSISNVYSTGTLSATGFVGGTIGENLGATANLYWNTSVSGVTNDIGKGNASNSTGLTTAQFTSSASFTGFDFSAYWRLYEGHTVPLLKVFLTPLTITADGLQKIYDGTGYTGGLSNATYSIAGAGTSSHLLGVSTAYSTGKNAGTYTADLWTDGQNGYDITIVGGTFTIDKATLTVAATGSSKVYDGTTAATVSLSANVIGSDAVTLSIGDASYATKNAANGVAVAVSGITIGGADAGNYVWNTTATTTGDITQKALTLSNGEAASKTYDGTAQTTVTGTLTGLVSGDSVSIAKGVFADSSAGDGKSVSVLLTGTDVANYSFTQPSLLANIYQVATTPETPVVVAPTKTTVTTGAIMQAIQTEQAKVADSVATTTVVVMSSKSGSDSLGSNVAPMIDDRRTDSSSSGSSSNGNKVQSSSCDTGGDKLTRSANGQTASLIVTVRCAI